MTNIDCYWCSRHTVTHTHIQITLADPDGPFQPHAPSENYLGLGLPYNNVMQTSIIPSP